MKLLVTGGMGFIGSNFILHMMKTHRSLEIINLDQLSYGSNLANLRALRSDTRYRFVRGRLQDTALVKQLMRDTDAVVNFAAESHVDRSISGPFPFVESNVVGVCSVLEAMRSFKSECTLLHVGTDEEFGDILIGSRSEESLLRPSSPYAASKAAASMMIGAWQRTYGIRAIITRCTNNFGPYQFPEKLIPKTIIRASMGLSIPIYGAGRNVRDWIYVLDHCRALDLILRRGRPGETYNIAGGSRLSNLRLVRRILRLMKLPESRIDFVENRPGHDSRYSLDSGKIERELGWRPRHDFSVALAETIAWYEENEAWWKPLATSKLLHPTPWRLNW